MENKTTEEKKITITEHQLFSAVMKSMLEDEKAKELLGHSLVLILLLPLIAHNTWEVLTKERED